MTFDVNTTINTKLNILKTRVYYALDSLLIAAKNYYKQALLIIAKKYAKTIKYLNKSNENFYSGHRLKRYSLC